jgi:Zn-dependent protease
MQEVAKLFVIAAALALGIYSLVLHEVAHALAASYLGDPTARLRGRLTLNPLKHIDPFHTLVMPLITYFVAGIIFGGAKPVPVNPYLFRNRRKGMMLTAIAGPAMNLLILLTCVAVVRACSLLVGTGGTVPGLIFGLLRLIFLTAGFWNLLLMIFKMTPVPPRVQYESPAGSGRRGVGCTIRSSGDNGL